MIRPSREGEDRQLESIKRRHLEQRGVGPSLRDRRTVEAMEIVPDHDVLGLQPADEITVRSFEPRPLFPFPQAFLAFSAGGHSMESAVLAKFDVKENKGQSRFSLGREWLLSHGV